MKEEDKKRAASVRDGLTRKAKDVSAYLSLAGKKIKNKNKKQKFTAAVELTRQMSMAALQISASALYKDMSSCSHF